MNKVALEDIVGNAGYEKVREQSRQRIIELKRQRRVSVGDKVSLVFENRDTVIFQIQEMMRAEKISDLDKIREEIKVYNELIPAPKRTERHAFYRDRGSNPSSGRVAEISGHRRVGLPEDRESFPPCAL